tara:strand:- start:11964 stop:12992 length:1029 start_codon:yes stop_codon:yes gene_type:complete
MKALFIGLGSIGQRHLRNLVTLEPDVHISALRRKKSKDFVFNNKNKIIKNTTLEKKYNITIFSNLNQALKTKFDLIFITNPSSLHFSVAKQAIGSGSYIFIEKPAVHLEKDLLELQTLDFQKKIFVGYQYRFHPVIQKTKELLNNNELGNLISARFKNAEYLPDWHPYEDYRDSYAAQKKLGGGALLTQIHDLDYSTYLLGPPSEIFAVGGKHSSLDVNVEDSVQILMSILKDNKRLPVSISLNYVERPPERVYEIVGDRGKIQCDLNKNTLHLHSDNSNLRNFSYSTFDRNDMFLDEMKAFLNFASGNSRDCISLNDSSLSLKMVFLAIKSMSNKKSYKLN